MAGLVIRISRERRETLAQTDYNTAWFGAMAASRARSGEICKLNRIDR
jgi:hypothetical protein